ncbi:MAG: pyridoxal-phosphate dependent enzyme, partial [Planktotalea sp.]|uniref:pyridoxal-phosphate dependent enzyme n=1 Tax=Planktotalea sp. TaxID=2029877 RepID=UPI003C78D2F3
MSVSFYTSTKSTINDITAASQPTLHVHPFTQTTSTKLALVDFSQTATQCHKPYLVGPNLLSGVLDGAIQPGTKLVIPSSGNTASTVAFFGDQIGLPVKAFMPEGTSLAKIKRCRDLGAEVTLIAPQQGVSSLAATNNAARVYAKDHGSDAYLIDQFGPAPYAHDIECNIGTVMRTACLKKLGRTPGAWVGGVGTGDSLMSMRRTAVVHEEQAMIVLADIDNGFFASHARNIPDQGIEGLNGSFIPSAFHSGAPTKILTASVQEAHEAQLDLKSYAGLDVGPSSGLIVSVALKLCWEL